VYDRRDQIKGLKFVYEPAKLRFFQGRFESM
jgi:tryptophanase